jgi:hypothetical protein
VVDNSELVSVREQNGLVTSLQLYECYPNPAKGSSVLKYFSPQFQKVAARLISVEGKTMKDFDVDLQQGYGEISLNLETLAPGEYFFSVQTQTQTKTRTIIVYE